MLIEDQNPHNKSLVAAVLGKPNAGKSSLINELLGFDLTIVTSKPQTTRNQFKCIFTIDESEIVLVDTPGVHKSNQEINKRMNGQAEFASDGVDLNLLLLDLSNPEIIRDCKEFMQTFTGKLTKTWVVFTKNDLAKVSDNLMKSSSLNYICYPLLVSRPIDRDALPTIWTEDNFKVKMYFL